MKKLKDIMEAWHAKEGHSATTFEVCSDDHCREIADLILLDVDGRSLALKTFVHW